MWDQGRALFEGVARVCAAPRILRTAEVARRAHGSRVAGAARRGGGRGGTTPTQQPNNAGWRSFCTTE
jgi:hypothetical protein